MQSHYIHIMLYLRISIHIQMPDIVCHLSLHVLLELCATCPCKTNLVDSVVHKHQPRVLNLRLFLSEPHVDLCVAQHWGSSVTQQ